MIYQIMKGNSLNDVLRAVSRSFYLTLRFLPRDFRAPTSLAYLLARASDTVADYRTADVEARLSWLKDFEAYLNGETLLLPPSPSWIVNHDHEGEKTLIKQLPTVVEALTHLKPELRSLVDSVLLTIVKGQISDLEFFEIVPQKWQVRAFVDDKQLSAYTYSVAGCVGEFWTKIGLLTQDNYSNLPEADLLSCGINYGKGLQLVNILRDVQSDEKIGRCYIPNPLNQEENLRKERERLIELAKSYLAEGEIYAKSLNHWQTAFATMLPAKLGLKTLEKIEQLPQSNWKKPVKISRKEVYGGMWQAFRM